MRARCGRAVAGIAGLVLLATGCGGADGRGADGSGPERSVSASGTPRGDGWRIAYASASRDAELVDIAAVSETDGWALGEETLDRTTGEVRPVLLRRTGGGDWKPAPVPRAAGEDVHLTALEASGPENVWLFGERSTEESAGTGEAAGVERAPRAFRFDGERWRTVPVDFAVKDAVVLAPDDVWALNAREAWADRPVARHWDGERWDSVPLPASANALGAAGPDDVWAVGFRTAGDRASGDGEPYSQVAAMRWDGRSWKLTRTPEYRFPDPAPPEETAALDGVVAVSADEAWAFGSHDFNHGEGGAEPDTEQILLRWNGSVWKKAPEVEGGALPMAPDGAGGLVLGAARHLTGGAGDGGGDEDGDDGETVRRIAPPRLLTGRSEKITEADRTQRLWPAELIRVPGTRTVWGAGHVEVGARGDANFRRAVVVTYRTG